MSACRRSCSRAAVTSTVASSQQREGDAVWIRYEVIKNN